MRTISQRAFQYSESLREIELPESLQTLEYKTFANCDSLTKVRLPKSLQTLEDRAFAGRPLLTEIRFSETPQTDDANPNFQIYDGRAILDKTGTTLIRWPGAQGKVVVPDGVKIVGSNAFEQCSNLTEIVLPDSLTTVEEYGLPNVAN